MGFNDNHQSEQVAVVEESPDLHHRPPHLLAFPRPRLPPELPLITSPLLCYLLPIDRVLLLVPLPEPLLEVLPHISDDPGDFRHAQGGMLILDILVDVHAIQKEGAKCFLGRLWRHRNICAIRHWPFCMRQPSSFYHIFAYKTSIWKIMEMCIVTQGMKWSVSLLIAQLAQVLLLDHVLQPLVVAGLDSVVELEQRVVEEL